MSNVIELPEPPMTSADRTEMLKAHLHWIQTANMTTEDVVASCEQAVPGCTTVEIITALRDVAEEQRRTAMLYQSMLTDEI